MMMDREIEGGWSIGEMVMEDPGTRKVVGGPTRPEKPREKYLWCVGPSAEINRRCLIDARDGQVDRIEGL